MLLLSACGSAGTSGPDAAQNNTLVYASGDYTSINPALYEHGEINSLIFSGLTAHDADNKVVPALAESWEYDEDSYTYTSARMLNGMMASPLPQMTLSLP